MFPAAWLVFQLFSGFLSWKAEVGEGEKALATWCPDPLTGNFIGNFSIPMLNFFKVVCSLISYWEILCMDKTHLIKCNIVSKDFLCFNRKKICGLLLFFLFQFWWIWVLVLRGGVPHRWNCIYFWKGYTITSWSGTSACKTPIIWIMHNGFVHLFMMINIFTI